jgi:hypothetical protein
MKRSSKVILLFMGTAAAGSVSVGTALASGPCDPARPGFALPGFDEYRSRCMIRSGFGGSSHRFAAHSHGHAHSHGG